MASDNLCRECGAAIPADIPGGFCAHCLLSLGLNNAETASPIASPSPASVAGKAPVDLTASVTEKRGDRIGRYRLIEEIGHGGCGVVFLAEQEEPVRRKVALKVIKLGMDTRQVVARFEAERQALALMDHPNIAKVLDAGATAGGRPYFVMELVNGIRITDYCDQHHLTTRGRLDLFVQVCHAIQHAHQKGIIHRDIKPSNVLVTTHDGVATPKVIDFGIAKATQGRLTDQTFFTAFEQFLGTPAYMSPEQAEVAGLDIDTRSDIYSLGVLLYELLTGQTPFDARQLLGAGLEAMRRTIRETEPVTPSTRLAQEIERGRRTNSLQFESRQTTASPGASPSTADKPRTSPERTKELIHQLRGDLDWIVMKCLEKDRARRYETANGLALDIERHLHHEPVVAGPPSNLYRFQKFVRRNKGATLSVIAIAMVLLLGVTVNTWQAVRATEAERQQKELRQQAERAQTNETHARRKAQTEAAKSQQVASFLSDMLRGVGPSKARGRDTTMLKEILDKTSERIGRDLTNQPEVELEIGQTLANTYHELGLYLEMEQIARQSLAVAQSLPGGDNLHIPAALEQIGDARQHLGDFEQAEQFTRQALTLFRLQLGEEHHRVAYSLNDLATILQGQEKLPEAEAVAREAVRINRKVYGDEHPETTTTFNNLADILRDQGKLAEAETLGREILALRRTILGPDSPSYLVSLINLGGVLQRQGKPVEAEAMEREALASAEKVLGDHPNVATCLATLATCLQDQGKLTEAEQMARRALSLQRKLFGDDHPSVAKKLQTLGRVLQAQKQLPQAEEMYRAALAILQKRPGEARQATAVAAGELAGVLKAQGKWAEAETAAREALALRRILHADDPSQLRGSIRTLAAVLQAQEKWAQVEPLLREALEIERKRQGPNHRDAAVASHALALILEEEGKPSEAESLLRQALSVFRAEAAKEPPQEIANLAIVLHHLAAVLRKRKALPQARELANEALALYRLHPELGASEKEHAIQVQARVEADLGNMAPAHALLQEQLQTLRASEPLDAAELSSTLSQLTHLLLDKGKFADAEPLARECWTLRKANFPNDWRTFSSAAVLGRCLLGLKRYTEAEPLLLSGYEGMKQREANIPSRNRVRLEDAARNLVQIYDATGRPDQGAQWKQRLEEYEQSQASPSPR